MTTEPQTKVPSGPEPGEEADRLARLVVDACLKIHRELGPGLLESVYERVLAHELEGRGCHVERQVPVPISYAGMCFEEGFRADLIINRCLLLELKSVERVSPVHKKQILTYLRLMGLYLGLLVNFGEELMKTGIHRIINNRLFAPGTGE